MEVRVSTRPTGPSDDDVQKDPMTTPTSRPVASVQLYSLASEFSADMSGSLDKLAALGLRNVEAFSFDDPPAENRAAL